MAALRTLGTLFAAAGCAGAAAAGGGAACEAASPRIAPTLVELYTSEGCSSCPPADRWLSTLKGRADVVALAFHVDYWDRLGWVDRFASPATTARQYQLSRWAGSASVYTPQVVVDGRDTGAGALPARPNAVPSPVHVSMRREGDAVTAEVEATAAAPGRLDGYWAVVEDGHESKVRAGENAGATLHHDDVVRLYRPVAAWSGGTPQRLRLDVSRGDPAYPRRVVFVVTDATTHRPLQVASIGGC